MTKIVTKEATPFQKAGYTEDTVFKVVLPEDCHFGQMFVIDEDDGTNLPYFKLKEDPSTCGVCYFLPGMQSGGPNQLEVFTPQEESLPEAVASSGDTKGPTTTVNGWSLVVKIDSEKFREDLSRWLENVPACVLAAFFEDTGTSWEDYIIVGDKDE